MFSEDVDKPVWALNATGSFTVRSVYRYLTNKELMDKSFPHKQFRKMKAPSRIAFFSWDGCILTIDKLRMRRGFKSTGVAYVGGQRRTAIIFFSGVQLRITYCQ